MAARLEYTPEHHQFRQLVRDFVQRTVVPSHESWERNGQWDRSLFIEAGKRAFVDARRSSPGT
jgi:hypothetical protein